jgi:hypothetical protein
MIGEACSMTMVSSDAGATAGARLMRIGVASAA